jgi:hypothetical protein
LQQCPLRSGDIWVKGRRYKNFDDYLIPTAEFEKSRHNDQLQLAVQTDSQAYLQARMTFLHLGWKKLTRWRLPVICPM